MICAQCGLNDVHSELCVHHISGEESWGRGNKIICDLLHRGIVPTRLSVEQRQDGEYWTNMPPEGAVG